MGGKERGREGRREGWIGCAVIEMTVDAFAANLLPVSPALYTLKAIIIYNYNLQKKKKKCVL